MPELPEVETVVRALAPYVTGRRIVEAEFRTQRILIGRADRMSEAVKGRRIAGVSRRGKFIVFSLEDGPYLIVHLGMTGRLLLGRDLGPYTHALFRLSRGTMVYDDPRQFGRIEVSDQLPARIAALGPDALSIEAPALLERLKSRRAMLKPLLLNQKFLGGMGNIYTDEALFRAGIHPRAIAAKLRRERALRLHAAMREILEAAVRAGGSSVSDYVDAEGRKGFFQFEHKVYQKTGEPCARCGAPIRRILVSQRGTHFCPKCQRL
jgi:formamidopyrimidine-DNA glycosylase